MKIYSNEDKYKYYKKHYIAVRRAYSSVIQYLQDKELLEDYQNIIDQKCKAYQSEQTIEGANTSQEQ